MDNYNININLVTYNHHSISAIMDQIEFFTFTMRELGYKTSFSQYCKTNALNFILEHFMVDGDLDILKRFCYKNNKTIGLILTEHLSLNNNEIYFNSHSIKNNDDYSGCVEAKHKRVYRLIDCINFSNNCYILGDTPNIKTLNSIYNNKNIVNIPFPGIELNKSYIECSNLTYDTIFSGSMTKHRAEILKQLKSNNINTFISQPNNSKKVRDQLLRKSKVVLNIPQNTEWEWSSPMRTLSALKNNRPVVSFDTSKHSITDNFMSIINSNNNYIENITHIIKNWKTIITDNIMQYNSFVSKQDNTVLNKEIYLWAKNEALI